MLVQIQCIAQISRSVGSKLNAYFKILFPILSQHARHLDFNQSQDLENEISEAAQNSIENLIRKCSPEAKEFSAHILDLAKTCLVYDPNYQYNDDDGQDEQMDDAENEGWGSDFYDDEQDDDDDTAWKVRKAAIKVFNAFISCCPLHEFWKDIVNRLSERFIERDDNVKCEILDTFQLLIKTSLKLDESVGNKKDFSIALRKMKSDREELGEALLSSIIRNLIKQLKSKNIKVKIEVMKTFVELAQMEESHEKYLASLAPYIQGSIAEGNNDMISYSLAILKQAFRYSEPDKISVTAQSGSEGFGNYLCQCLEHNQSRIVSETLRVTGLFVIQLQDLEGNLELYQTDIVKRLYNIIYQQKLIRQDIDQEVKQSSIIAIAQII